MSQTFKSPGKGYKLRPQPKPTVKKAVSNKTKLKARSRLVAAIKKSS
jgi:hypothetical protein